MEYFNSKTESISKKNTVNRNRMLLFPFFAIVAVIIIMYMLPNHEALIIRTGNETLLIFTMKDGENFQINFYDSNNEVNVVNTLSRDTDTISLDSMLITGNSDYIPSGDDMPQAEYTKVEEGYLISKIDMQYQRLQLNIDHIADYTICFRGKEYHLNDYTSSPSVTLFFEKVSLGRITRYDPGFKLLK